ncbi:MAG: hypothetical protein ACTHKV_08515 [Flavipsychrobacter sp.]
MSTDITKSDAKEDAYNKILAYMKSPEENILTSVEENILFRWTFCHTLLRDRKLKTEDIIEKIADRFSVSKFTARNDIGYTQALYVEATNFNKEYHFHQHIEDMKLMIEKWKGDKSLAPFVPKLLHEYTLALSKLPETIRNNDKPTVINNFFVVEGQKVQAPLDYEDAHRHADQILEKEGDGIEDIDFEETNDDDNSDK